MKKIFLTVTVLLTSVLAFSQFNYGIQGGVNYNFSGDLKEFGPTAEAVWEGTEKSTGYHGGLWFRYDFGELFIKTEAIYTQYKSEFESDPNYELKTNKIDIPVVVGAKLLGPLYVFAGPDFQYKLDEDFSLRNSDVSYDKFTMGLHVGAGLDFGKVSVDVRWDKGLTGSDSKIVSDLSQTFTLDNRANQLMLSVNFALSK